MPHHRHGTDSADSPLTPLTVAASVGARPPTSYSVGRAHPPREKEVPVKHPDDDHELCNRLEVAEMAAESGGEVVDLDKAWSARGESPDPAADFRPTESAIPVGEWSADWADDDPDDREPVMVDGPAPAGPGLMDRLKSGQRREVIPVWAKSRPEFLTAPGWLGGDARHTIAYHGVRLPWYSARLVCHAPVGVATFVGGTMRWVADTEGELLRQVAARRENVEEYLKLSRQRDRRVKLRGLVLLLALVIGLPLVLVLFVLAPTWLEVLAPALLTAGFGFLGAPSDKPVISRAVVTTEVGRLTSGIVERAPGSLGIAEINKALGKGGEGMKFPAPITRDGPGWRADVDLPYGVTVPDILDRREKLASGLRRPLGCVRKSGSQ